VVVPERLRTPRERPAQAPRANSSAPAVPSLPTPAVVLALQRSAGNQAVGRLLARQEPGDAPRKAPVLTPSDPRLFDIFDKIGKPTPTPPKKDAPPSLPWLPRGRTNLPIKIGEGTRRSPKLKDPGAPGGALCRGACGVDCPPTCKWVGTYREEYVLGNTGYLVEFPNAILCGTHEGCRWHDSCFDVAVGQGENPLSAPIHSYCNLKALEKYGREKTMDWMQGRGPYDGWWYFVDNPFVVRTWAVKG
jgi:hypothetical protein